MGGVADDGVGQVLQVAADLVAPAGGRLGQHQAGAGAGMARVAGLGQVQPGQAGDGRVGVLGRRIGWGVVGAQWVVDLCALGRPAAHQGQVLLAHGMRGKGPGQGARGGRVQAHDEHAAGALVQAVHGVDMLADLVAQGLHHEARLAGVQPRAVHQPAGGLVQRHQVLVLPQDGQRWVGAGAWLGFHEW